jgi:glycosyltransferase involved in cell wall biosynthesis
MNTPILSICIPTWNRAELLADSLEHLLFVHDLSFPVEIIVSDNHSTDGTMALLESYASKLPLRIIRQHSNVGIVRNTLAAFRAARGTYSLYLADDDRLVPDALERLIALLLKDSEVVILNVPWTLVWDRVAERPPQPFYALDKVETFGPNEALDCLNFVVNGMVMPEIAIYRTDVLHKLLLYPNGLYVGFVLLFRALRYGKVCFHPDSYYRQYLRSDGGFTGGSTGQEGHRQVVYFFDQYRGSLETSLLSALQKVAPLPIPEQTRTQALRIVNNFLLSRLRLAAGLCLRNRDFIAAYEMETRALLWRPDVTAAEIQEWEERHLGFVAIQSIIENAASIGTLRGVRLCGFPDPDQLLEGFAFFAPELEADTRNEAEAVCAEDREAFLYVVDAPERADRLTEAGILPGHILCLTEVMDQFRVLPRTFTN